MTTTTLICQRCQTGNHDHERFHDDRIAECPWQVIPGNIDIACECPYRGEDMAADKGDCEIEVAHSHRWVRITDGVKYGIEVHVSVTGVVMLSEGAAAQLLRAAGYERLP